MTTRTPYDDSRDTGEPDACPDCPSGQCPYSDPNYQD
jgi:hypothetical protein